MAGPQTPKQATQTSQPKSTPDAPITTRTLRLGKRHSPTNKGTLTDVLEQTAEDLIQNLRDKVANLEASSLEQKDVIHNLEGANNTALGEIKSLQTQICYLTEKVKQKENEAQSREESFSEHSEGQLQEIQAKENQIKALENENAGLLKEKQNLEQELDLGQQHLNNEKAESRRLKAEVESRQEELRGMLAITRKVKDLEDNIEVLLKEKQALKQEVNAKQQLLADQEMESHRLQKQLQAKHASVAMFSTPERLTVMHPCDSSLSAKRLQESMSGTPMDSADDVMVTPLDVRADIASSATAPTLNSTANLSAINAMSSHSEPKDAARDDTQMEDARPPLSPVLENHTLMSDEKGSRHDESKDEIQEVGGMVYPNSPLENGDESQQPCNPSRGAVASNDTNGDANALDPPQRNQNKIFTGEQEAAVMRVRRCSPTAFYDVLGLQGVSTTVADMEIKNAYRELILLTHPDKNGHEHADQAFKLVNKAFGVLGDPKTKARYDLWGGDSHMDGNNEWREGQMSPRETFDTFNKFFGEGRAPFNTSCSSGSPGLYEYQDDHASSHAITELATVDLYLKRDIITDPSSPPAAIVEDGLDLSLDPVAVPSAVVVSSAGSPSSETVASISSIKDLDASTMKNSSVTQPQTPLGQIDDAANSTYIGSIRPNSAIPQISKGQEAICSTEATDKANNNVPATSDIEVASSSEPSRLTDLPERAKATPIVDKTSHDPQDSPTTKSIGQQNSRNSKQVTAKPSVDLLSQLSSSSRSDRDGRLNNKHCSPMAPKHDTSGNVESQAAETSLGGLRNSEDATSTSSIGQESLSAADIAMQEDIVAFLEANSSNNEPGLAINDKKGVGKGDHIITMSMVDKTSHNVANAIELHKTTKPRSLCVGDGPQTTRLPKKKKVGSTTRWVPNDFEDVIRNSYQQEDEDDCLLPYEREALRRAPVEVYSPGINSESGHCSLKLPNKETSKLTRRVKKELIDQREQILENIPSADELKNDRSIQSCIRYIDQTLNNPGACHPVSSQAKKQSWLDILDEAIKDVKYISDKKHFRVMKLLSTLAILKDLTKGMVNTKLATELKAREDALKYRKQLRAFNGINNVIQRLDESYRGLHIILILLLWRNNKELLQQYFRAQTVLAAVTLLVCRLNHPYYMSEHIPRDYPYLRKVDTMLAILQHAFKAADPPVPLHKIEKALGYSSDYSIRASACTSTSLVDAVTYEMSKIDQPSHSLPTPLPSTKKRRPESVGTLEFNGPLAKRQRREYCLEFPTQLFPASTQQLFQRLDTSELEPSDQLDMAVESLARELKEKNEHIEIQPRIYLSGSILGLRPNEWFNDELINAATGLVKVPVDSRTSLLSSFLYEHLRNGDFAKADRWVKNLPREHAIWGFGICEEQHWVATLIDFEAASILYYDPWEEKNPNPTRCRRTLECVKGYAYHLNNVYNEQRAWDVATVSGPKQELDDFNNCGVFVLWFLCALKSGRALSKGSILLPSEAIDPLEFRKQVYRCLQNAPRKALATVDPGTDTDDPVQTSFESKGKGKLTLDSSDEFGVCPINASVGSIVSRKKQKVGPTTPRIGSALNSNDNATLEVLTPTTDNFASLFETPKNMGELKGLALMSDDNAPKAASTPPTNSVTDSPPWTADPCSPLIRKRLKEGTSTFGPDALGGIDQAFTGSDHIPVNQDASNTITPKVRAPTMDRSASQMPELSTAQNEVKRSVALAIRNEGFEASKSDTEGEKTAISTNTGDAEITRSIQLVHSVQKKRKNDGYNECSVDRLKRPRLEEASVIVESISHCATSKFLGEAQAPNLDTESETEGATIEHPTLSRVTVGNSTSPLASPSCEGLVGMGQPSKDVGGDSRDQDVAVANILATLHSPAGSQIDAPNDFPSMEAKSLEKSVSPTIWSENFVNAGIKSPAYPSTGEHLSVSEPMGDQIEAETITDSQGDITFSEWIAEDEEDVRFTGFNAIGEDGRFIESEDLINFDHPSSDPFGHSSEHDSDKSEFLNWPGQ